MITSHSVWEISLANNSIHHRNIIIWQCSPYSMSFRYRDLSSENVEWVIITENSVVIDPLLMNFDITIFIVCCVLIERFSMNLNTNPSSDERKQVTFSGLISALHFSSQILSPSKHQWNVSSAHTNEQLCLAMTKRKTATKMKKIFQVEWGSVKRTIQATCWIRSVIYSYNSNHERVFRERRMLSENPLSTFPFSFSCSTLTHTNKTRSLGGWVRGLDWLDGEIKARNPASSFKKCESNFYCSMMSSSSKE